MTEPTGDASGETTGDTASGPSGETPALAPGWYPDPDDGSRQAYWNGTVWHRPKTGPGAAPPAGERDRSSSGRPRWLLPGAAVVVVVLIVVIVAVVASSRHGGSTIGAGSGGGNGGGGAAGPQATGPRVGSGPVSVVLPDGWELVPMDEPGFATWADTAKKDNPDIVAALSKLRADTAAGYSVLAVKKGDDGKLASYVSVKSQSGSLSGGATGLADQVENQLTSSVHDVSVTTGSAGGRDAVLATYDLVSALVPPQGGQVYVIDPKGIGIVTVLTYDSTHPLDAAKAIAATVAFS
jgi:hypothetical protein